MLEKRIFERIWKFQKCALDLQGNWKKSSVNEEAGTNRKGLIFPGVNIHYRRIFFKVLILHWKSEWLHMSQSGFSHNHTKCLCKSWKPRLVTRALRAEPSLSSSWGHGKCQKRETAGSFWCYIKHLESVLSSLQTWTPHYLCFNCASFQTGLGLTFVVLCVLWWFFGCFLLFFFF